MSIDTLLKEEIQDEFEQLGNMAVGSDEYKVTVDGLAKLMDRAIEMKKFDTEVEEKRAQRNVENDLKVEELRDERRDRIVKNCIAVGGILIPTAVTIWGTRKSIEFEKEGTFTTIMGRGFINKLLPKK